MSGDSSDQNKAVYADRDAGGSGESVNKSYLNPAFVPEIVLSKSDSHGSTKKINVDSQGADIDFDDLLPHIGEFGRYQKILFLLMIPFAFFVAFVYFAQIFITLVPEMHWCRIPELADRPIDLR